MTGFPLEHTARRTPAGRQALDLRRGRKPQLLDEWQPSPAAVEAAWSYLQRTNLGARLDQMLTHRLGRPRTMRSDLYLLGFYLNALRKGHRGCVLDATRALLLIPSPQRELLGVPEIALQAMYRRFDAWYLAVTTQLAEDWGPPAPRTLDDTASAPRLTIFEVCQEIIRSPLTDAYLRWPSIAIDGTDFPTFGNLHIAHERLPLDGDAVYDDNGNVFGGAAGAPPWDPSDGGHTKGGAKIFGIGADGREIHTLDTEARSAYRTATGKRSGGKYEGYEVHVACAMAILRSTDQVTYATFSATPPPLCLAANVTPGGTHRGVASLAVVEFLNDIDHLREVAADRGITYMRDYGERLRALNIQSVHTLHSLQRRLHDGPPGGVFIDQTLFSDAIPADLLKEFPLPTPHLPAEARRPYEEAFNKRALYRWRNHAGPDSRGSIRLACPICTSPHLRCRQVPRSMRLPQTAPLVRLPEGRSHCCSSGTVTFSARDYPLWMGDVVPFTTAHFMSYGRRNAAETLNSFLHGLYVDLNEKWAEPFGTAKRSFLVAFTLAGINHHLLRGGLESD